MGHGPSDGEDCGDDQGSSPNEIEIDPSFPQEIETELLEDHCSDQNGDQEVAERVNERRHYRSHCHIDVEVLASDRVSSQSDIRRFCHAEEEGHDHEARTVGSGHEERPPREAKEANTHGGPARVSVSEEAEDTEGEEENGNRPAEPEGGRRHSKQGHDEQDDGNGQTMADSEREHGLPDVAAPSFLHSPGDSKEPAHPRVEAVEGAESEQAQPSPCAVATHR